MKRINVCQFGKIMLQLFCWRTVIASVYLLEKIPVFDVREFYVQLVARLKSRRL